MTGSAFKEVAVLGAGVMGAGIAALLAAAGCRVRLLDRADARGNADGLARQGLERALASRPPAFYSAAMAQRIECGGLEDLSALRQVDWVIEAIVEHMEAKRALLARVQEAVGERALVSTNTSGLSIAALAEGRSASFCRRFMGVHFFNPPRYMQLVELVPGAQTDATHQERLRRFLEEDLGKGVVVARDTPNFIANRLGVFALMASLWQMQREGLSVEEVDAFTGPLLGRPKSATLRLCDLIGLDTLAQVAGTGFELLADEHERAVLAPPPLLASMLEAGLLGAKVGKGFYRKGEEGLEALDLEKLQYRPLRAPDLGALGRVRGTLQARLQALWETDSRWGALGRAHLLQVLAHAAGHAGEMAADLTQIDRAMRWGFNWEAGPFAMWDHIGAERLAGALRRAGAGVPPLVEQVLAGGEGRFYAGREVFSAEQGTRVRRSSEPGEDMHERLERGLQCMANERACLVDIGEGVGVLLLRGKMNTLGPETLEMVERIAVEAPVRALVLYGEGEHFSAGADLRQIQALVGQRDWSGLEALLVRFQRAVQALRRAPFPVVAAPRGLALGGGCEFCLGSDLRLAHADLRMGLVETRVGLVPGAGGCMELVRRCGREVERVFEVVFAGNFTESAHQAREWGFLSAGDEIHLGADRLLERAVARAGERAADYGPPAAEPLEVAGEALRAKLVGSLQVRCEKGDITAHDLEVGTQLARVLCGGGGEQPSAAEDEVLALEREAFLHLCGTEATQARIAHMLETGKPLRN